MKDRPGEAGSAQRRSAWGGLRRTLAVTADRPQGPAVGGAGECGSPEIPSKTPSFSPLLTPDPNPPPSCGRGTPELARTAESFRRAPRRNRKKTR